MAQERDHIVFSLDQQDTPKSALEEERERHRQRAERFGTQYKDPAKLPKFHQEARRERFRREGFATGIDLFSEEEQAKKAARAKKFGLTEDRQPLNYTLDPEDLKKAARAKKFGIEYERPSAHTLLQKADLFEPRKDAPEDVPRRENAIYLYGIDLMSTRDVFSYFDEYGATQVEWINDSSCCVVFEDAASTIRAIAGCGHPLAPEDLASAPDSMDTTMGELDPQSSMPYLWHKGKDFIKGKDAQGKDIKISLMYRMATDLDQKDPHAEKRSRYLWHAQGKRRREDRGYQQQQHGRGHGRGRRQRQQQQHQGEWHEGGDYAEGDVEMQPAGSGRRVRRRKQRRGQQHLDGDINMQDARGGDNPAAEGETPVEGESAATDHEAAAIGGGRDLRGVLHEQHPGRHKQNDEDLPWEVVPQPDGDPDDEQCL